MILRLFEAVRFGLILLVCVTVAGGAFAAPYAALVMDARSGEIIHSRNADTRLHPASLTKMMTLYVVFEAVRRGEIQLTSKVTISKKAAAEPPSKLGLKAGQKIELRYLIRAAAVKSANDAATALGEAISGSEAAFARRMNKTARALGMTRTTFKNAHGLTESGHLSTARDMTTLGRHMIYDYPQYYNLFSRQSTDAGVRQVRNTNRRLLQAYKGADGIKTGYTNAAGFNLVASAERGRKRIIATVFGGRSTASRNAKVAELLDLGFGKTRRNIAVRKPTLPKYASAAKVEPKVIKVAPTITAVRKSLRPIARPVQSAPSDELLLALVQDVGKTMKEARKSAEVAREPKAKPPQVQVARSQPPTVTPIKRPRNITQAAIAPAKAAKPESRIITRASTSGGRHWGISLGKHTTKDRAERQLLQVALQEIETLDEALRKVVRRPQGWEANFVGMTQQRAQIACQRLTARGVNCKTNGPG